MLRVVVNNATTDNVYINKGDLLANLIFSGITFAEPTMMNEEAR